MGRKIMHWYDQSARINETAIQRGNYLSND